MRILVCGGRAFADRRLFGETMARYADRATAIIHGAAPGADALAGEWARTRGIEEVAVAANWKRYGYAAGPIRNRQMLTDHKPDLVIAFPGGKGTANMVAQATQAKVPTIEVTARASERARGEDENRNC